MAKYGENETVDTLYEHPERICSGIYAIKLTWPTIGDKTNIMMELDNRKTEMDKYECTLSIFYESVKFPRRRRLVRQAPRGTVAHTQCVFIYDSFQSLSDSKTSVCPRRLAARSS